ncbi:MAG: SRPBCC domain-containing protein [Hyphomicrobiales bacterium]|nr:SRPBCC domain-containing protein [Hyphomicrobiales bacterium]
MSEATITKTAFFDAPRETVWAFLTEKEKLARWFHPADADLAVGRDYVLLAEGDGDVLVRQCWGTVLEMDRPSRLVYTFTIGPMNGAVSTVTWTLSEAFEGTRLTLEHTGLENAGDAVLGLLTALDAGWDAHLARLRQAV